MMQMIGALLAVLVAGGLARADFQFQDWWFDRDQPGQLPSGFVLGSSNVGSGRWEVKADPLSSSPPNVLAHISSDQAGLFPQVLFLEKVEAANLELSVRIKTAQDGECQGSGVVFRVFNDRKTSEVCPIPLHHALPITIACCGSSNPSLNSAVSR